MFKTKREANKVIVSLSNTSKMPGKSYGLKALNSCPTGAKLAKIPGSVCSDCYACKGMYQFPNVQNAQLARIEATHNPQWIKAMITAIGTDPFFRWHDSGDIYSLEYLEKIIEVVKATPNTKHWLPTREKKTIRQYLAKHGEFPKNIVVRVSATMIDGDIPKGFANTSSVHDKKQPIGIECKASTRKGKCGPCRKCWNPKIKNVSYSRH